MGLIGGTVPPSFLFLIIRTSGIAALGRVGRVFWARTIGLVGRALRSGL
jgi:hypothetical protein